MCAFIAEFSWITKFWKRKGEDSLDAPVFYSLTKDTPPPPIEEGM
jgi:hypothetical protein